MKKIIITLCLSLILAIALVSCGKNNNNNNNTSTTEKNTTEATTKNDGMITETGTDTSIIDNVESAVETMIDGMTTK